MLYIYYGNNRKKVADQAQKLVASLLAKKPDAQVFSFEEGESYVSELDALIEAQGLFVERHIILIKQPLQDSENKEYILNRLEQFAQSSNIVVILEDTLLASHKKKFDRHAEKIEEHTEKKTNTASFNIFQLGDLLGKKQKRELWTAYTQALKNDIEVESIHGTLHWAVRGMLLAQNTNSPEDSGQKPFMHSKFKKYTQNFEEGELNKQSRELVSLYHDARRGRHDLKVALEHWILSL